MYEQFYGLDSRPFDLSPNPRYFVLTDVHREALSNLEYAIASRTGVTLLIGEAGTGKTTVIRTAIEKQPARIHCVHLHNPALSRAEFVTMLAAQFSLSEHARNSKTDLLIMAGQPELATRLSEHSLRQLKQRIALRCELRPLSVSESGAYIAKRIAAAGGVPAQVFTREAVVLLHEYSRGIPRTLNVLADNALLGGFATGQRRVTRQLVLDACADFDIASPQPVRRPAPRDEPAIMRTPGPSAALPTSERRSVDSARPAGPGAPRKRGEQGTTANGSATPQSVLGLRS
jgi:general secretion pathway protein A